MPTLNLLFIESCLGGIGVGIFSIGFIAIFIRRVFKFGVILMLLANVFWLGAIVFPAKLSFFLLEHGVNDDFLNQDVRYIGIFLGFVFSFFVISVVFFIIKKKQLNIKAESDSAVQDKRETE